MAKSLVNVQVVGPEKKLSDHIPGKLLLVLICVPVDLQTNICGPANSIISNFISLLFLKKSYFGYYFANKYYLNLFFSFGSWTKRIELVTLNSLQFSFYFISFYFVYLLASTRGQCPT